jgi:hypothetical protein
MGCCNSNELGLVTAVSTLAATLASCMNEEELAMSAAFFTQLGDTLATIALRRNLCKEDAQTE